MESISVSREEVVRFLSIQGYSYGYSYGYGAGDGAGDGSGDVCTFVAYIEGVNAGVTAV